jgi:hypothetical protein
MTEQCGKLRPPLIKPSYCLPQKRRAAYGWPFCHIGNKTTICHNDKLLFGNLSFTTLLGISDVDIARVVEAGASRGNAKKTECGMPHDRPSRGADLWGGQRLVWSLVRTFPVQGFPKSAASGGGMRLSCIIAPGIRRQLQHQLSDGYRNAYFGEWRAENVGVRR